MKKLLLFFAALSLVQLVQAQSPITIEPNFIEFHRTDLDLTNNNLDEVEKYTITNVSDETVNLIWVLEVEEGCTNGWQTQVCDNNLCYFFTVTNNIPENIPPADLEPGESSDLFSLHVWPRMQSGCCNMYMHYFLEGNLQDTLGTVTFEVQMNDASCSVTNINEEFVSALKVFPNPTTDYFQLEGNENNLVDQLHIYNQLGQKLQSFNAMNQTRFDLANLPQGQYFVHMVDANGAVLKTTPLNIK